VVEFNNATKFQIATTAASAKNKANSIHESRNADPNARLSFVSLTIEVCIGYATPTAVVPTTEPIGSYRAASNGSWA
jgi:hypothetical protein